MAGRTCGAYWPVREKMARFGHIVSRAAARDFALAARPLFNDPAARRIFARPNGAPPAEQGKTDSGRSGGYLWQAADDGHKQLLSRGAGANDGRCCQSRRGERWNWRICRLTCLSGKRQSWLHTGKWILPLRRHRPGSAFGGALMWNMLATGDRYRSATADGRAHLLVETAKRAFAGRECMALRKQYARAIRVVYDCSCFRSVNDRF